MGFDEDTTDTMGVTEAAAFLHMSADTLVRKARAGLIPGSKPCGRWIFQRKSLLRLLHDLERLNVKGQAYRHRYNMRRRELRANDPIFRAKITAAVMCNRARRLARFPVWADAAPIHATYIECARLTEATGIRHEVDHELPLLGKTVSGLHVHENLRIVAKSINRSKGNRYAP